MAGKTRVIGIVAAVLTALSAFVAPAAATPSGAAADCGYLFTSDVYNTNLTAVEFTAGAAVVTAENEGGDWNQFNWCVNDPMFPVGHAFTISPYYNQNLCLDWGFVDGDSVPMAYLSSDSCAKINLRTGPGCADWYCLEVPLTGSSRYLEATGPETARVAAGDWKHPWQIAN